MGVLEMLSVPGEGLPEVSNFGAASATEDVALGAATPSSAEPAGAPLIGRHPHMQRAFELIASAADSRTPIWLHGEPGSGKSFLAGVIHQRSARCNAPLVELDCAALPELLLGSELFGHAKGAFTGAMTDKDGRIVAAAGGTIFLDNIDAIAPALQERLLRLLAEKRFEPIGGGRSQAADGRLITARASDLEDEVRTGRMLPALVERLRAVRIEIPPLRDRLADIPALAALFLRRLAAQSGQRVRAISSDALQCLQRYAWPENLRELELVLERAVILSRYDEIQPADLPPAIALAHDPHVHIGRGGSLPTLREALVEPERRIIAQALHAHDWNRQRTAEALKIDRTTLYKKMRRYGLLGTQKPRGSAVDKHQPEEST
jgi:DNA-binding NtrC family response regulator